MARYPDFPSSDGDIPRAYNVLKNAVGDDMDNALTYEVQFYYPGQPAADHQVVRRVLTRAIRFPANLTDSQGDTVTPATASSTFSIQKNGTQFGTMAFAISSNEATFTGAETTFAAGDIISIVTPNPADSTLASITFTLLGVLI